jgi:hypothetical protein
MDNKTTIVWLDKNINKNAEIKIKLKPRIPYIELFDSVDDCLQYINMGSHAILN